MTYIPNVREEGVYNQDNIKDNLDKEFVRGYDYAVEQLKTFFANIDVYDGSIINRLDKNQEECDELQEDIEDWMESQRNELVVSIIDGQEDDADDDIAESKEEKDYAEYDQFRLV